MEEIVKQTRIDVPDTIINEWQSIADLMARLIDIPVGLIMRIIERDIEVFVSSETENNPYNPGDHECLLGSGLYCETVIRTKDKLLVPNALNDKEWKDNPDIEHGLVSYLGFPLLWPDGNCFGTICILDNKENHYTPLVEELITKFRTIIQGQLELIYVNHSLGEENKSLMDYLEEIKTLRGIVPICSHCKKIRDDEGFWESVESYISKRTEARFSHGICPTCMAKLYPDLCEET